MPTPPPPVARDLIVIGGSAGSIGVLKRLLAELPRDLPAALMVVVHQGQGASGVLADVLGAAVRGGGGWPARNAVDGEPIELGTVYVAPPDHHIMVEPAGRVRLSRGPKQNRFRPAIDPLFRTAARVYGSQLIGVVLSGYLDDGTFGLMQVKRFGGVTVCQDPHDAEAAEMPASAIREVRPDYAGAAPEKGAVPMSERRTTTSHPGVASEAGDIADRGDNALTTQHLGPPTAVTCPQCGGAIWETTEGGTTYFRCHVGHAYSPDSMLAEHTSELEQTLWEALRMFQENAVLHHRMADRAARSQPDVAARYRERAEQSLARTELIRRVLLGESDPGAGERRSA
jgi:two-component system chemotaxis response regulator CheB